MALATSGSTGGGHGDVGGVGEGCAVRHRRQRSTLASRTRSRPSGVLGPELAPPWSLQRRAIVPSGRRCRGARQGAPPRVRHRAPHRSPLERSDILDVQLAQCAPGCHPMTRHAVSRLRGRQLPSRLRASRARYGPRNNDHARWCQRSRKARHVRPAHMMGVLAALTLEPGAPMLCGVLAEGWL